MKDRKEQIDENSEMLIFFSNTSSVGFISITTHSRGEKRLRVENMLKEPFKKRHKPKNQPVTTAYDRTPTILNLSQFRSHFYNILYIKKSRFLYHILKHLCKNPQFPQIPPPTKCMTGRTLYAIHSLNTHIL